MPTWCCARERNVRSRAGWAVPGVGALGPAPASQAEERDGSLARDQIPRIKLRKQGVSDEFRTLVWVFSLAHDVPGTSE